MIEKFKEDKTELEIELDTFYRTPEEWHFSVEQLFAPKEKPKKSYFNSTYFTKSQFTTESLQGTKNPKAKLTDERVLAIRRDFAKGDISQKELVKKYQMSQTAISFIVNRVTWKHI